MSEHSPETSDDPHYEDWTRDKYIASLVIYIPLLIAAICGAVWMLVIPFVFAVSQWALLGALGAASTGLFIYLFIRDALAALSTHPIEIRGSVDGMRELRAAGGGADSYYFSVGGIEFESETIYRHLFPGGRCDRQILALLKECRVRNCSLWQEATSCGVTGRG